jgi:hypothetical protein
MAAPRHGLLLALLLTPPVARADESRKPVDFTREVRPLLVERCFKCHGPDENTRKAGLRLDERGGATKALRSGLRAVVPGDPAKSELIARVRSKEPTEVMPPAKVGKPLGPREVELLERWVREGAPYARHWAYVAPRRPPVPNPRNGEQAQNPVDRFILEKLDRERLSPAPEADRAALLRRVTLDLTGLPPTIGEADRFFADRAPGAYERLVERLLASPAFGERWAVPWLDLARYADSQGYANDPDRTIWPWRDWVVRALNANVPYDQFTVEQLAGDLLPGATTEQRIATGFHRNTLTNTEGGTNPEEFRSAAVVDRVNTTFSVWLATTMACAQCHSHKYDPFAQKEYYQVYAIFNSCEDANTGDDAPALRLTLPGKAAEDAALASALAQARRELWDETARLDAAMAAWEKWIDRKKLPREIADALGVPAAKRPPKQKNQVQAYYRRLSEQWRLLDKEVRDLDAGQRAVTATTPVLRELAKPRPTQVHIRGDFQDKGEAVAPGLPAALGGIGETISKQGAGKVDRLALARWLVSDTNPLTARVAVNRLWEELFGVGLVETSEDFGTQGDLPSHPELLDWLATEYMRSGWDTKRMLRLLVTSATYRQSSNAAPELAARDPANRLLARGPRVRLSAEMLRDQALAVSGLLSRKMHGPPVQPPRPTFSLAAAFGGTTDWNPSPGEDRLRRGLYTRVRRNAPYPSFTTFDAPERTFCNVRRLRTNTPLQALVTLNDPVFFEAAQALARRVVAEGGAGARERVNFAFRLCLTRTPTAPEADRLLRLYESAKARFASQPDHAVSIATRPLGPIPAGMDPAELAAWTIVGNTLLNLDETLAKR